MYKTKIRNLITPTRIAALLGLSLLVVLSVAFPLSGQANFTQGFGADSVLQKGMIVRLQEDDTSKVKPLSFDEMEEMYGVVVSPNDAPVTLSSEGQKVFVATAGKYDVLVSSQNGPINAGDYITISAFNGIGMKAGDREPVVVGRALTSYDGEQGTISTADVTDAEGNQKQVAISRIAADISVSRNPLLKAEEPNIPEILRRASEAIAGKPVDPVRVYIAVIVFLISTFVAGTLLYGGVRSGIISIGRNPLSKKSIIRGMLQVVLVGLTIFISGLFGVYLILRL